MSSFKYKLTGVQETITRLHNFGTRLRRKVLTKCGNEASKIALKTMKANPPPRKAWGTGTWRKSLGRKVKVYVTVMWYVVGPRSSFIANPKQKFRFWRDKNGRVRKSPAPTGYTRKFRPVLYTHLIEPKHGMIRRSVQQSRAQEEKAIARVLSEAMATV